MSSGLVLSARGYTGVDIAQSPSPENELIAKNSPLCGICLTSSIGVRLQCNKRYDLFVNWDTYSSDAAMINGGIHCLKDLLTFGLCKQSDFVDVCDMSAHIGWLCSTEPLLGKYLSIQANGINTGDRLLQLCVDYKLYLAKANFQHRCRLITLL